MVRKVGCFVCENPYVFHMLSQGKLALSSCRSSVMSLPMSPMIDFGLCYVVMNDQNSELFLSEALATGGREVRM